MIRWKQALIAGGLSAKTISDGKLVAVRTIVQWGVDSRRLVANPAADVRMDVKKAVKGRRGDTDAEAATILAAARQEANPVLRRVPWLCAYSGARLSEVCQLRVADVREIEGIACMAIDAEAGSVKTAGSERVVPLHQAVLDAGFLSFVQGVGTGPLFAGISRRTRSAGAGATARRCWAAGCAVSGWTRSGWRRPTAGGTGWRRWRAVTSSPRTSRVP